MGVTRNQSITATHSRQSTSLESLNVLSIKNKLEGLIVPFAGLSDRNHTISQHPKFSKNVKKPRGTLKIRKTTQGQVHEKPSDTSALEKTPKKEVISKYSALFFNTCLFFCFCPIVVEMGTPEGHA